MHRVHVVYALRSLRTTHTLRTMQTASRRFARRRPLYAYSAVVLLVSKLAEVHPEHVMNRARADALIALCAFFAALCIAPAICVQIRKTTGTSCAVRLVALAPSAKRMGASVCGCHEGTTSRREGRALVLSCRCDLPVLLRAQCAMSVSASLMHSVRDKGMYLTYAMVLALSALHSYSVYYACYVCNAYTAHAMRAYSARNAYTAYATHVYNTFNAYSV